MKANTLVRNCEVKSSPPFPSKLPSRDEIDLEIVKSRKAVDELYRKEKDEPEAGTEAEVKTQSDPKDE